VRASDKGSDMRICGTDPFHDPFENIEQKSLAETRTYVKVSLIKPRRELHLIARLWASLERVWKM